MEQRSALWADTNKATRILKDNWLYDISWATKPLSYLSYVVSCMVLSTPAGEGEEVRWLLLPVVEDLATLGWALMFILFLHCAIPPPSSTLHCSWPRVTYPCKKKDRQEKLKLGKKEVQNRKKTTTTMYVVMSTHQHKMGTIVTKYKKKKRD